MRTQPLDPSLLTVKITTNSNGYGTGFFLLNDLIITCAHVIQGIDISNIKIFWQGKVELSSGFSIVLNSELYDVALIKLDSVFEFELPLSKLQIGIEIGQRIISYGYTDVYPQGVPVLLESEGFTGDQPPLIKIKSGRIRPGLSGAPVMDIENGNVYGMIKYTDDRLLDIGGGAISSESILEVAHFFITNGRSYEMPVEIVNDQFFSNKESLYLDKVDTEIKHGSMWRWNQRMFKHRHPKEYVNFDLVGLELGRSWWHRYHDQDWVLRDWNHQQIGTYCLNPIKKEVFDDLAAGIKIETQIIPEDILTPADTKKHKYWYWANFMSARTKFKIKKVVKEYANNLMIGHALDRAISSEHYATSFGEEIAIIGFAETKSTAEFVSNYGFTKAFPHTTDPALSQIHMMMLSRDMAEWELEKIKAWLKEKAPTVLEYKPESIFQQPPNY